MRKVSDLTRREDSILAMNVFMMTIMPRVHVANSIRCGTDRNLITDPTITTQRQKHRLITHAHRQMARSTG